VASDACRPAWAASRPFNRRLADAESKKPDDEILRLPIASMTKPVTARGIMMMMEEGTFGYRSRLYVDPRSRTWKRRDGACQSARLRARPVID